MDTQTQNIPPNYCETCQLENLRSVAGLSFEA